MVKLCTWLTPTGVPCVGGYTLPWQQSLRSPPEAAELLQIQQVSSARSGYSHLLNLLITSRILKKVTTAHLLQDCSLAANDGALRVFASVLSIRHSIVLRHPGLIELVRHEATAKRSPSTVSNVADTGYLV